MFFSKARGICLEVIVDEYNSLQAKLGYIHNASQGRFMARLPTRGIICHEVIVDG